MTEEHGVKEGALGRESRRDQERNGQAVIRRGILLYVAVAVEAPLRASDEPKTSRKTEGTSHRGEGAGGHDRWLANP